MRSRALPKRSIGEAYRVAGYLSREEAAEYLGVSLRALERRYTDSEKYPCFPRPVREVGALKLFFRRADLDRYIAALAEVPIRAAIQSASHLRPLTDCDASSQ